MVVFVTKDNSAIPGNECGERGEKCEIRPEGWEYRR